MLLKKYKEKLPDNPKRNNLVDDGDTLDLPTNFLGFVRCIIPYKEKVSAPQNPQRFITHPTKHSHKSSNNYIVVLKSYTYIYIDKELWKYFSDEASELWIINSQAPTRKYFDNSFN